jgi:hypothetical protein
VELALDDSLIFRGELRQAPGNVPGGWDEALRWAAAHLPWLQKLVLVATATSACGAVLCAV